MDRNTVVVNSPTDAIVALRKESVDRNSASAVADVSSRLVALRKESVDRNPADARQDR